MQAVTAVLAVTDVELPDGQIVQSVIPILFAYAPIGQAVQAAPSAPLYPTLHLQSVNASLTAGEFELVGHV